MICCYDLQALSLLITLSFLLLYVEADFVVVEGGFQLVESVQTQQLGNQNVSV